MKTAHIDVKNVPDLTEAENLVEQKENDRWMTYCYTICLSPHISQFKCILTPFNVGICISS